MNQVAGPGIAHRRVKVAGDSIRYSGEVTK
jgi:hypothetical protein